MIVAAGDCSAAPAVVHERVNGFLEHALFVAHDDFGRHQVDEPLEPVVAVDDPAIQVVQVAGGEASAVQLHHRAQFGRQHGQLGEYHPVRLVLALAERFYDAQALDRLLVPLA